MLLFGVTAFTASPLRAARADDLPARAVAESDPSKYAAHPRVAHYLQYFTHAGRERMGRWLERGAPYFPMIRDRLASCDLPEDLRFLPLIESGFANGAVSRAGAVGMWQFMPATARRYGLRVDGLVDERRDPIKSTDAAARHLRDLLDKFGSPFLAAAAYNAGAGPIERGLNRLYDDSAGDSAFFRLSDASMLARETSDYVPQCLAASIIARDPEMYGFRPSSDTAGFPAFDSVIVAKPVRLSTAARLAGISERVVSNLNPQYVRGITPDRSRSMIRFPAGSVGAGLADSLAKLPPESPPPIRLIPSGGAAPRRPARLPAIRHVIVHAGDTPHGIADRFGVSEAELRRLNVLPRNMTIRPGQILRLPEG